MNTRRLDPLASVVLASLVGCGGGGGSGPGAPPPASPEVVVSAASPFSGDCGGGSNGTLYAEAEVEPYLAINPTDPANLIAVWQQDRWSDGGARGLVSGASFDGGRTWSRTPLPVSRCGGGDAASGADYSRASDPWVSFAPDGTAYAISLSFAGGTFTPGSASAVLVVRSIDGGLTWSEPAILIADGADAFNDKETLTADPTDPSRAYAVWDRAVSDGSGPTWFARTVDGGASWEPARPIYDPGPSSQTLGNLIVVLPDGTLVDVFTQIDTAPDQSQSARFAVIRSTDHGATWGEPIVVSDVAALGAVDPDTQAAIRDSAGLAAAAVTPDGTLLLVWQDARAAGGAHDGIALTSSADGGLTWSDGLAINADPSVTAFTPSVAVSADGTIGVTYFDFRDNTSDPRSLPTSLWLTESSDGGATWTERAVTGPFDLALAPNARGLFLGDYQGLASDGEGFVPLYARTNTRASNRTDVYAWDESLAGDMRRASARAVAVEPTGAADRRRLGEVLDRVTRSRWRGAPR